MNYLTVKHRLLLPFQAIRRFLRGPNSIAERRSTGRKMLNDLLDARDREFVGRDWYRRGLGLDHDSAARPGVLDHAGRIFDAATRDLGRASWYWQKVLSACHVSYEQWKALEDSIRNARDYDEAIERALKSGNYQELDELFDHALEHKEEAIKQAKAYLESLEDPAG